MTVEKFGFLIELVAMGGTFVFLVNFLSHHFMAVLPDDLLSKWKRRK